MIITEEKITFKTLWSYMALAYLFGVLVRLIVLQNVWGIDAFWYEGRILPIWSDDAGLYGYYAKQLLAGVGYPFYGDYILAHIIASTVQITGLHIDWVMLLLPAFLAPLVVIPIIGLGYFLKMSKFAFYASLIGVIGINYYTRSYLGYLDTDTINLFLSYFLVSSFALVAYTKDLRYAIISIVALVFLYSFYHSSKSLIGGILALNFIIILVFYTKEKLLYQLFIVSSVAFVLAMKVHFVVAIGVPIALIWVLRSEAVQKLDYRVYIATITVVLLLALVIVDLSTLYGRAIDYFKLGSLVSIGEYQIVDVLATVDENQQRSIFSILDGFIGITFYVLIATLGYMVLVYHRREFIFFLPLLLLGFLSFKIGIRFTMYAEFVLALGFVYLLHYLKKEDLIHIGVAFGIFVMAFNILRVNGAIKPKYFTSADLKALKTLNIQSNDKMISWWDYGWPLWYYLGSKNTYIDNGQNTQGGTLFVSKMLLASNAQKAYNLAKLISTNTRDLKLLDDEKKLVSKANQISIVNKNIYIVLHRRMWRMFSIFSSFGDRDLQSGKMTKQRVFDLSWITKLYTESDPWIEGSGFQLNIKTGVMITREGKTKLHGVIALKGNSLKFAQTYNQQSNKVMVFKDNRAIYMDKESFDSLFVQALILDRVISDQFTQVFKSQNLTVLKVN